MHSNEVNKTAKIAWQRIQFCMHYEHKLHFAALIVLMPSANASGINMTMRAAKCKIMLLMHK
jgi:hypothetical protein